MTVARPGIQFVKDFVAAHADGNWEATLGYLHENLVVEEAPSMPYPRLSYGHEGYRKLLERFVEVWYPPDWGGDADYCYGEINGVVIKSNVFRAKARATGVEIEVPLIELFFFEENKIRRIMPYYWDTAAIAAATGGHRDD